MAPIPITVYYSPVSLASYMLRYTLAIRGTPTNPEDGITIEEKRSPRPKIHLSPHPSPLPDSLAITTFFAKPFLALKPPGYEAQIDDILNRVHAPLPYFILSFGEGHRADHVPKGVEPTIRALLDKGEVQGNEGYTRALGYKLSLHTEADLNTIFGPKSVRQAEKEMRRFLEYVDEKLPSAEGWLFGLERPTAADAHVVALAVRLLDVGREELLLEKVSGYVERARRTEEWRGADGGFGDDDVSGVGRWLRVVGSLI